MTAVASDTGSQSAGTEARSLRVARYVGVPIGVLVACGLMYLYIAGQELDSIEARIITVDNIISAAREQVFIAFWATLITLLIAVPLGVALTRPWASRVTPGFIAVANIGQGVPAIGLLFAFYIILTRNPARATIYSMATYAVLPVLRGTMVGLDQVDRGIIKAARGMGMSKAAVLFRIELPLAVPILLTGVRTALVLTVATCVLGAFIGAGTFGLFITAGQTQGRQLAVVVGSLGAAVMAILADWLAGIAEDLLRPKGL